MCGLSKVVSVHNGNITLVHSIINLKMDDIFLEKCIQNIPCVNTLCKST